MEIVEFLLMNGAYVNSRTHSGCTPLHIAATYGTYLRKFGTNSFEKKKPFLTHQFLLSSFFLINSFNLGQERAVEILLQHGADINMKTYKAFTPLHLSVISAEIGVMELLLRSGSDVNISSDDGKTPIHTACKNGECFLKLSVFLIPSRGSLL